MKEIDLNKLSFRELKNKIQELEQRKEDVTVRKKGVFEIGKNYVIRTVTMIDVGKLVDVQEHELVLEDAAWVADTGRWAQFLSGGTANEVEPFPDGQVIVGRHAIIDAVIWKHELLRKQK